jgi:hypothetical protein
MAEKKISLDLEINKGSSDKSVKSIKTELREAKEEAIALARKFGELSPEATKAASKLASLKDEMGDLNEKVNGLNPDKFARLATLTNGVVRGFQAASGAAVLFGNTSEDIEKTIAKLQATMALADGIQGVMDARKSFVDLGNQIKGSVVKAFTTLKGAIIATGLGAIAVAVGVLVANWDSFTASINKSFPALKQVGDFFKNIKQVASGALDGIIAGFKVIGEVATKLFSGNFSGAYDAASKFGTKVAEAYNKGYEEKDKELKEEAAIKSKNKELQLLEAQGKDITNKKIELLKRERALLDKESDEYFQKTLEIEKLRTEQREKASAQSEKSKAEKEKQREEERQSAIEDLAFFTEWEKEVTDLEKKEEDERFAAAKKATEDRIALAKTQHEEVLSSIDLFYEEQKIKAQGNKDQLEAIEMAKQQAIINSTEKGSRNQIDALNKLAALKAGIEEKSVEDLKAAEEAKLAVRMAALDNLASIGNSIVQLAGKNKQLARAGLAIEEAAGIAKIVINTQVAAAKANATYPPPFGQIAAGIAITSGALSIAASIKATQKAMQQLGGGGSSNSTQMNNSGGGGGMGIQAPQTGFTQIRTPQNPNQPQEKQPPVKVFVVQKDIQEATIAADRITAKAVVK